MSRLIDRETFISRLKALAYREVPKFTQICECYGKLCALDVNGRVWMFVNGSVGWEPVTNSVVTTPPPF